MRIVAGRFRGKILKAPADRRVRPTGERVREALFNILEGGRLGALPPWPALTVLDAYAGSGALGLEALSRGAAAATFMENDATARRLCAANLAALGDQVRGRVLACDVLSPPRASQPADLVFLDPPYGRDLLAPALTALAAAGWVAPEALVVGETGKGEALEAPPGYRLLDRRDYGRTSLWFLGPCEDTQSS